MTSTPTENHVIEPRRRRDPDGRPHQILDAALDTFGAKGFAAARLDDIAQQAGVAKGTIYLYFPTKEDLFKAVVRREIVGRIEEGERLQADQKDLSARDFLQRFLGKYWDNTQAAHSLHMLRMVLGELHRYPELARFYGDEVVSRAWNLIASIVQRGVDRGEFRPVDPMLAARCITGTFLMHRLWTEPTSPGHHLVAHLSCNQLRGDLVDFFVDGLAAHPAAPSANTP
jgi:AcrR family transcriptional regulator